MWQMLGHIDAISVAELFDVQNLRLLFNSISEPAKAHMTGHDMGVFFTTFVLLQFWNIFNAKYFRTNRSLIVDIVDLFRNRKVVMESNSSGFWLIVAVILVGQVLIVNFAGSFFNVTSLPIEDWLWLLLLTSPVLIIPDVIRTIRR
jgi:Ca2+-transporting ATPase